MGSGDCRRQRGDRGPPLSTPGCAVTYARFVEGNKSVVVGVQYKRLQSSFRWGATCNAKFPGWGMMDLTNIRIFQKLLAQAEAFMDKVDVQVAIDGPWGFTGNLKNLLSSEVAPPQEQT